jgi:septal ring factor EnvC (AmiA/AmiB activator)
LGVASVWIVAAFLWGDSPLRDLIVWSVVYALIQLLVPDSEWFRKWADREQKTLEYYARLDSMDRDISTLDQTLWSRYRAVSALVEQIEEHLRDQPAALREALEDAEKRARSLKRTFYRIGERYTRLVRFLNSAQPSALNQQLKELPTAEETPAELRGVLANRRKMLQARVSRLEAIQKEKPVLFEQLNAVEDALSLLRDHVVAPLEGARVRVDVEEICKDVTTYESSTEEIAAALEDLAEAEAEVSRGRR